MTVSRTTPPQWMIGCLVGIGLLAAGPSAFGGAQDGPPERDLAELRDGRRIPGALVDDPDGGPIAFRPGSGGPTIPVDRISRLVPGDDDEAQRPPGDPQPFLVLFGPDERLSGRLVAIDGSTIRMELGPDASPAAIDRGGVTALLQRPGEAQVVADRFDDAEAREAWTFGKDAGIEPDPDREGSVLALEPGGSEARLRLPEPIEAGRVELSFYWEGRRIGGHRWSFDLIVDGPNGEEVTRIVLGWADEFPSVESRGGPEIVVQPLVLEPGWHRLTCRFGPGRTLVSVDGNDLGRGGGPRGALVALRFRTEAARDADPSTEAARIDDLLVIRSFEPTTSPDVDPTQDELRMVSGDQIWGALESADGRGVRLRVIDREVDASWSRVAGLLFRRLQRPSELISGPLVRVQWEVGDPESRPDRIEGALVGADADGFRVATPYAGTITVPRPSLRRIDFLGRGRRQVIDPHSRHLGDQIMPELDPPFPDSDEYEARFELDAIPEEPPELVIDLVHVEGDYDGGRFADEIRQGFYRTNLLINGDEVDSLNRYVRDANRTPSRVRIPIPIDRLQVGPNVLRFEQVGRKEDPDDRDDLALIRIALEWAEGDEESPD